MLEYSIAEAEALLSKNLKAAQKNLGEIEEDLGFLRDQYTTTEVSILFVWGRDFIYLLIWVKRRTDCLGNRYNMVHWWMHLPSTNGVPNREWKKPQQLLQWNCGIKIELSVCVFFHVGHMVHNRQHVLSLACNKWFASKGREWKIYCCGFVMLPECQIWNSHITIWQSAKKKKCTKRHASCATIRIFPHSPNHISDLWHCHFLKSLVPFQHMVSLWV